MHVSYNRGGRSKYGVSVAAGPASTAGIKKVILYEQKRRQRIPFKTKAHILCDSTERSCLELGKQTESRFVVAGGCASRGGVGASGVQMFLWVRRMSWDHIVVAAAPR